MTIWTYEIYPSPLKKFVNTNLINITAKITSKTANTAPPAVPPITAVIGAICSDFVETPENILIQTLRLIVTVGLLKQLKTGIYQE